jgi:hypothetical protein
MFHEHTRRPIISGVDVGGTAVEPPVLPELLLEEGWDRTSCWLPAVGSFAPSAVQASATALAEAVDRRRKRGRSM